MLQVAFTTIRRFGFVKELTHLLPKSEFGNRTSNLHNRQSQFTLCRTYLWNHYPVCQITSSRSIHDKSRSNDAANEHEDTSTTKKSSKPSPSLGHFFVPLEERHTVISDVIDEQWNPVAQPDFSAYDPDERINLARGKTGVFDLDELVELLEEEKAFDTCVVSIPKEMKYADYLVLVTARSPRHLQAVAGFIRRVFKRKKRKTTDIIPVIEGGETARDWVALDLGNIALHIFIHEKRMEVDLETLWTVGPQFDELTNQSDSAIVQMLGSFNTADLDINNRHKTF